MYNDILLETNKEKFWNKLINVSSNYELDIDKEYRRNLGIYYTRVDFAKYMIEEMFSEIDFTIDKIVNSNFFEPCVGIGSFVFAYLKYIYELNKFSKNEIQQILNNMYFADANKDTLIIFKELLKKFVYIYFDIKIDEKYFANRVAGALVYDLAKGSDYIGATEYFKDILDNGGFDIIVTNPPYKNLKADSNKYLNTDDIEKMKIMYKEITKDAKQRFKYSVEGSLNLYKLFIEEILNIYSNKKAIISILIPSTMLTDKTCKKLRSFILDNHCIKRINVLPEKNEYINAQQALSTFLIKKDTRTDSIKIINEFNFNNSEICIVNYEIIKNETTGDSIFAFKKDDFEKIKILRKFPYLKDLSYIVNLRGELDVTNNKKYVKDSAENYIDKYKLIRGRNVRYYNLNEEDISEYVDKEFVNISKKAKYINSDRIVGQQIANIHKDRRLTFCLANKNYIIANSCNFLVVEQNDDEVDIYNLLGILNSELMNWLFKLTSSNNHINNYEIDAFPIPIKSKYLKKISEKVKLLLNNYNESLVKEIDDLVYKAYGLYNIDEFIKKSHLINNNNLLNKAFTDIKSIVTSDKFEIETFKKIILGKLSVNEYKNQNNIELEEYDIEIIELIISKYIDVANNKILNHTTFKLSDLDLEMIQNIPQGGNWKYIPEDVVLKSKRLTKIAETGGRTTLYGRIDYSKPCYTITTYFNRPGNGTYVHPEHNRVISVREAARIQSFKDDYMFLGNKKQLLTQVGNAVPPILAYEIGKKLIEIGNCKTSVDLFAGAGGMTVGFKDAGIKCIVANDFEKMACKTLKINNPEIKVLEEDITKKETKNRIYECINEVGVDIVCGGPPCQGFSHAGKRFIDDPRNELFKDFVEIVSVIKPKIVVIENVEGMVTFNKGAVYKEIIELYNELGYKTLGKIIMASDYGVPQKRKRVIIICTREDLNLDPETLFPVKNPTYNNEVTARDAILDLATCECGEESYYKNDIKDLSLYAKFIRNIESTNLSKVKISKTNENIEINNNIQNNTYVQHEQLKFI